jgi:hypothetical protein
MRTYQYAARMSVCCARHYDVRMSVWCVHISMLRTYKYDVHVSVWCAHISMMCTCQYAAHMSVCWPHKHKGHHVTAAVHTVFRQIRNAVQTMQDSKFANYVFLSPAITTKNSAQEVQRWLVYFKVNVMALADVSRRQTSNLWYLSTPVSVQSASDSLTYHTEGCYWPRASNREHC